MTFSFFSKNGIILPEVQAVIPLSNIEYSYGYGVYETVRVTRHIPYFLNEHLDRLIESCRIIELPLPYTKSQLTTWVMSLIEKIEEQTFNLKLLLIGSDFFILASSPLFPDRKWVKEGISTITVDYERRWVHAKTLNMLGSFLAYKKAKEQNCYDALLVNKSGEITEGTRTNVYFVKDSTVYSPPSNDILLGVMRMVLLKVLQEAKIEYKEQSIPLSSIGDYEGAFLTSTSTKILPIRQINNFAYTEVSLMIQNLIKKLDLFLDMSHGKI
jgi:branched-subunit amino acid aminotransferase/4-amino-4-deoxychorismate lyase